MKLGLFGKKLGMTQHFDVDGGRSIPVTVLHVYESTVLEHRSLEKNGYPALVVGFEKVPGRKLSKARAGYLKKHGAAEFRRVRELRVNDVTPYPCGTVMTSLCLGKGDRVDVVGISKGKGFQGVIKRHGKHGGPAAHGSRFHRSTGSIGQRTYPGKVFKNMGMPGRMGGERVMVKNLEVITVDGDQHLVFVKGAVPGTRTGLVFLEAKKARFDHGLQLPTVDEKSGTQETGSAEAVASHQ